MRNSELGRVIAGLSLVVLLTVAISVAVVVEANWGGRGLVTIAAACTPTPTPTQTQTPPPCNCVSDNYTTLTVTCSPICLSIPKQATQSDGWKGAIKSLISVEDFDWIWDMENWEWWPDCDEALEGDAYNWTFSPEVDVTQAGDYNVQVKVDDFPTSFPCPHGNIIFCHDDPSTTVQARVIVYSVQTQITGFNAGSSPYDATPIISSFITNSETECSVSATASVNPAIDNNVNWTIEPPSGWTCANAGGSLTYSQTATVPAHPDGGRSGWTITLKAKHPTGEETSVSASQSTTDRIRQMYVDHGITVPDRSWFSGTEIPLRPAVTNGYDGLLSGYQAWCGGSGSLRIESRYRNPEHNEDQPGHSDTSMHMYGYAIDINPVYDSGPNGGGNGKEDDAQWIVSNATSSYGATYAYKRLTENGEYSVHVQWMSYDGL